MRYRDTNAHIVGLADVLRSERKSARQAATNRFFDRRDRDRFLLLQAEALEPRHLLDGDWSTGEWLLRIDGLGGTNRAEQMKAANVVLAAAHIQTSDVEVVDNVGVPNVVVVEIPTSVDTELVFQELQAIPGFDYIEPFDEEADPSTRQTWFPESPFDEGEEEIDPDEVVPDTSGLAASGPIGGPNVVQGVNGFDAIIAGGVAGSARPPDSDGAVGPNSFIAAVNLALRIFQKSGTGLTSLTSFSTFFSPLGGTLSFSDPVVVYNDITQRFFVGMLDFDEVSNMRLDVAMSKSSNPATLTTADWNFFRYNVNDGVGGFDFADYPKVGYNADGYVVSFNMFPSSFDHSSVIAIRNDGTSAGIQVVPGGLSHFTLAPASMHGAAPGSPMWFVDTPGNSSGSRVEVVRMDNVYSAAPTFTVTNVSVNSFSSTASPHQPGGQMIGNSNLGTRMYFSAFRTVEGVSHLVAAHTVGDGSGYSRVRWYDINVTGAPALLQQGQVSPGGTVDTFFPGVDIAADGTLGLQYAQSSSSQFMSMYVAGRNPTDALGTMQPPVLAKAGTANISPNDRVGDYSFTSLDPADGSFWGINEYASSTTANPNWRTWVQHFSLGGLVVSAVTPAVSSAVLTPPTSYVVAFSTAVDPATVQASDFSVDGVAASDVSLDAANTTATFTFAVNPVAVEGPHTMHIAAGSITKQSDAATTISDFTGSFRYDALPLAIVSTNPPAGAAITVSGSLNLDVNFNEAVDPLSVQAADLSLSGLTGATVGAVSLLGGNTTARFVINGLASEGTLNIGIAAAAITDAFGNPNPAAFTASYTIDNGTTAFPTPLVAKLPLGSLVYDPTAAAAIAPAGDTDNFTLAVDAGQTISVVVTPSGSTLIPTIELRDPGSSLLGTSTALVAGGSAVMQTLAATSGGTYTVAVSGSAGSTGGYEIKATLNAALESEASGGSSNDTLATAQNIGASAVGLGGSASRLAVLGGIGTGVGATAGSEDFEAGVLPASFSTYSSNSFGRIRAMAPGLTGNPSAFALWMDSNVDNNYVLNEAVYAVNLSGLTQAMLSFAHANSNDEPNTLPADFTDHANGDGVAISSNGTNWHTILNAVTTDSAWTTTTIDLAAAAAAAGMTLGANFQIKFQQYDNFTYPTDGRGYDDIRIFTPDPQDTYQFTLAAGDTASVALKTLSTGTASVQLLDSSGISLATAVAGPTNFDRVLRDFTAPLAGSYYLAVSGAAGVSYDLVVTKNSEFEAEPNNSLTGPQSVLSQQVAGDQYVLGSVGAASTSTTLRFTELPFQPVNGLLVQGVQFGFTVGGAASTDANYDSGGPGALKYVQDPSLEGNAAGILTLDFTVATGSLQFGVGLSTGGTVTSGVVVQLYDAGLHLISTTPVTTSDQGFSFSEAQFNYTGTPVKRAVLDLNESAAARFVIDNLTFSTGSDVDYYSLNLGAGAALQAVTSTPAGGTGEFVNNLDPQLKLYRTDGTLVASDDNGADGRNALLNFTNPGAAATFLLAVSSGGATPTTGEYVLRITGNSPSLPPFQVASTTPALPGFSRTSPATLTVNFSDVYLAASLQASDLVIDGNSNATGMTLVDGDTVSFTLPALVSGTHTFSLPAGAVQSLGGAPLNAFSGSITIDAIAPRITATSIAPGSVLGNGTVSYQITFSEPMLTSNLSSTDMTLVGAVGGASYTPVSMSFDPTGTVLTLNYSNLPEDNFTLTLVSGTSGGTNFTDAAGNALDGEFSGTFPSGDGIAGGNFVSSFSIDIGTAAFPNPLTPLLPLGSLIYDPTVSGVIGPAGDTDSFTVAVDAGQTITVVVTPTSPAFQPSVSLVSPSNVVIGAATATAANQKALLQAIAATAAGTYTIVVGGATSTIGAYTVQVTLNAAVEAEGLLSGVDNNSIAAAQDISASLLGLQSGQPALGRGAVVGTTDATSGYQATAVAFSFNDISATGTALTALTGADDDYASATIPFSFNFYGTAYTTLFVSTNGLITFGTGDDSYSNDTLASNPSEAAIAPFWNDLYVSNSSGTAKIVTQTVGSSPNRQFIIQWDKVRFYGGSTTDPITFQVVLSEGSNSIQLNYLDLASASSSGSEGANATAGIKAANPTNSRFVELINNNGPNAYVGTGKSTLIAPVSTGGDYYKITLAAGDRATIAVTGQGGGNLNLDLRDSSDLVLATGTGGATNLTKSISGFSITAAGTYYARVTGDGNLPYTLVVTRNVAFDSEANDTFATAQSIGSSGGVLGAISFAASEDWYSFNVSSTTVPISLITSTPADGANEFVNTLNPHLELYDPSNALVASGASLADGRNESINYAPLVAGNYRIRVTGEGNTTGEYFFSLPIAVDTTAPRVTATSLANGAIVAPGALTYSVTFNEPMNVGILDSADYVLHGVFRNTDYTAASASFNAAGTVLTLSYSNLPDDQYKLTLVAGATGGSNFTDAAGNALDGEFSGSFPSGNGAAGGDFVIGFAADLASEAFPPLLNPELPLGSLIYDLPLTRTIAFSGDTDSFTLPVDPGQTITVLVTPGIAVFQPTLQLSDPSSAVVAGSAASAPGANVLLQTIGPTVGGTYTITVGGVGASMGPYTVKVYLNAAIEAASVGLGGDKTLATAQNLDASFIALQTPQASASRGAVIGSVGNAPLDTDYYSFTAAAGQTTTVVVKQLIGTGVTIALLGGSGNTLASGVSGSTNLDQVISNFILPTSGNYYIAVSANSSGTYDFVVTRDAAFDTEGNDSFAAAQIFVTGDGVVGQIAVGSQVVPSRQVAPGSQANIETGNQNAFPFHLVTTPPTPSLRYQQIYSRAEFASGGIIDAIRLRRAGTQGPFTSTPIDVKISLGYAATTVATASSVFSDNIGPNYVTVLDTNALVLSSSASGTPNPFDIVIDVDNVFDYEPALGDLLVDITVRNSPTAGGFEATGLGQQTVTTRIFANDSAATSGKVGNSATDSRPYGLVTDFDLLPTGDADWYSIGVNNPANSLRLETSTPADGAGQFINSLNPRIELYDPSGALVASGTALADGRNEFIQYTPLTVGTYRVRVTGESNTSGEYLLTKNLSPAVVGVAAAVIDEGGTASLSWAIDDPDALDSHTAVIDWGPGEGTTTLNLARGVALFTATHIFTDDNPSGTPFDSYPVSVTVTDNHGAVGVGSGSVIVNNLSPVITGFTPPVSINENDTFTLTGTFHDEGLLDSHTVVVSWGGGLGTGQPAQGTTTITTTGPNPPSTSLVSLGNGNWRFTADHQYLDDAPSHSASDVYALSFQVTDDDTAAATGGTAVTVNNVSPTITSLTPGGPVNENGTFTVTGTFHDPGTLDTHTIVIDWGGGQPGQPPEGLTNITTAGPNPSGTALLSLGNGDWQFAASHQYLDDKPTGTASDAYTIDVFIDDDDGGAASQSTGVTVNNVAPRIVSVTTASTITENGTFTLAGTFHDDGTRDSHTLLIDWDGGHTGQPLEGTTTITTAGPNPVGTTLISLGNGDWEFTADHQYLDDNPTTTPSDDYTVNLSITDDDGGASSSSATVTVNNVAPVPTIQSTSDSALEGVPIMVSGSATDVGTLDTITYAWQVLKNDVTAPFATGGNATTFSFTPDNEGTYRIELTATDDDGGTATTSQTITVINMAPVASDFSLTLAEDTPADAVLLATDVPADTLSYAIVTPPEHGTLSGTGDHLQYQPDANFNGVDSFTFRASDGLLDSDPATVAITVMPVNDAPTADSQSIMTDEDIAFGGLLTGNGGDAEVAQALTFAVASPPEHGEVMLNAATGAYTYQPAPNYNGPDSFSVVVTDDSAAGPPFALTSAPATVSVMVNAVNDPPTFQVGTEILATDEDPPQTVAAFVTNISAGPSDEAGQTPLTLLIADVSAPELFIDQPQIDAAGNLTFTPRPNAHGTATITVTLQDSGGTAAGGIDLTTQTFVITIGKPYPLHDTLNAYDVDGDHDVAPVDALTTINWINAFGSLPVITDSTNAAYRDGPDYLDVNRDNVISPVDALLVINVLNAGMGSEGEPPALAADVSSIDAVYSQLGQSSSAGGSSATMTDLLVAALLDTSVTGNRKRLFSAIR